MIILANVLIGMVSADSHRYCYDQIGDGHFCHSTQKQCKIAEKKDSIAESPCYKEDEA